MVGNVVAADAMMSGGDGQPETLAGVTVTLGGEHAMGETMETDMSGGFAFTGLRAGTYTVTISGFPEDVSFEEVSLEISVGIGEIGDADFTGHFIRTSAVEGQVIIEGEGLAGITVTLSGGPADESYTMLTDPDGMYRFEDLRPGSYTVSISDFDTRDYEFASTSQDVSVDLDETGTVSFTGRQLRTSGIAGRVSVEGMGLGGIEVTLSGSDTTRTEVTDDGGQYNFAGLAAGDYTVSIAVDDPAYVFGVMSKDVTVADDDAEIVNFDGEHARTASVVAMLFVDEAAKNDGYDDGEDAFPPAAVLAALQAAQLPAVPVPVTLTGPDVGTVRSGAMDVATGQITFSGLRAGSYHLQVGSLSALLAGLPPELAMVLQDYEYGGQAEGYAIDVAVGEERTQHLPVDITHTTVGFSVMLRHGDDTGAAVPGAMVTLYADMAGENKIGSGKTGENGEPASVRIARGNTSGNMVYAGVAVDGYHVAEGMTPVAWDPKLPATVGGNANDIVNLNASVAVSGKTKETEYGGGAALGGWALNVMMAGEDDEMAAIEGAPEELGDDGTASFESAVAVDDLPMSYYFAVAEEQNDSLDGGEMVQSDTVEYEHDGLSLAGAMDVALVASFGTQTLKVYVHHEKDQVEGYTGNVLGGDMRMSGPVEVEIRHIVSGGRARQFTKEQWDADAKGNVVEKDGVWTFSHVPADMNVIAIASAPDDANVIIPDPELAAYEDLGESPSGAFGEMGGFSHTVELCPLQRTNPQDHNQCASFAYINAYKVNGQAWKNGVERDKHDGFELSLISDDPPAPVAVPGTTVSMDPVAEKNLAGESASFTAAEKDNSATKGIDETKQFDFKQMADGVYSVGVPKGWVATAGMGGDKLSEQFLLADVLTDGALNIDVTPTTGVLYGRVIDSEDQPAEGVTVDVNGHSDVTDEFGRYMVEGFGAVKASPAKGEDKVDAMIVKASGTGFDAQEDTIFSFAANMPDDHDFMVAGAAAFATISGKVTKSGTGAGVADVKITVGGDSELLNPNAKSTGATKNNIYLTADDGTYSVQVRAGAPGVSVDVTLTASKDKMSFTPPSHSFAVVAGTELTGFGFTAFDHGTITGRVRLGENGPPLEGVEVTATATDAAEGADPAASYTTRATGTFRLSVPFGAYNVAATLGGYSFTLPNNGLVSVAPGVTSPLTGDIVAAETGNFPPKFTSEASFEVAEGETDIGTVTAEDPDDDDFIESYEILAGDDDGANHGDISIDAGSGELTFNSAPVFDDEDADNNVYEVTVQVTSGRGSRELTATQDVTVTVTDVQQYEVAIVLSDDEISEDGGTTNVTATVDPASPTAFAVEVDVSSTNDYTVSGSTLFFAAGATESTGSVSITAVNNNVINDDVEVEVGGSVVPSALEGYSVDAATLTITDDEEPNPMVTLSLRPVRIDEGGTATLTVTLDKALDHPDDTDGTTVAVSLDISTSGNAITVTELDAAGEAVAGGSETADRGVTVAAVNGDGTAITELNFLTGQRTLDDATVTLTAANSGLWEGDLKFEVNATATVATAADGSQIGTVDAADPVTLTVLENETAPSAVRSLTVTWGDASVSGEWLSPASWGSTHDGTTATALTSGTYQYRVYETDAEVALENDEGWVETGNSGADREFTATAFTVITVTGTGDSAVRSGGDSPTGTLANGTSYTVEVRTLSAAAPGTAATPKSGATTSNTGTPSS